MAENKNRITANTKIENAENTNAELASKVTMGTMQTKKLALLGFGNAGKAFAKLLMEKHEQIEEKYGYNVVVTAIATGTHGNLAVSASAEDATTAAATGRANSTDSAGSASAVGIDLAAAIEDIETLGKFSVRLPLTDLTSMQIAEQADYDVLVEMTPLNIFTGEPAITHIETAFARGKDVITANKGPIAWKFAKLRDMAKQNGCRFFHETTVMDGTPVFNFVEKTLQMAEVTEVSGILNSTTNYILEEMAAGKEYDEIIRKGQEIGFIEADPAMDIEGYDASAKITALLNVLMDAEITPDKVERKGIEGITLADIEAARSKGCVIKLICKGSRSADGTVKASVMPQEIPLTDMLASVNSTTSVVSVTTDLMKKISIVEHEPEIEQTAYGIFGDLLRVLSE